MFQFILFFICFAFHVEADVYRIDTNGITLLSPTTGTSSNLPDATMIYPGIYNYGGQKYDCNAEGLYRFYTVGTDCYQRIVHNYTGIQNLLHTITWTHAHGYQNDSYNYTNASIVSKNNRIHMTCGSICQYAKSMATVYSYNCRLVVFLTLDTWNGYNNGHTMLEVYENGAWKVWDVDFRNYFEQSGNSLNALEFRNAVQANNYEINKFSQSPVFAFGDLIYGSYDYQFWYEGQFLFTSSIEQQYSRCCDIVLIQSGPNYYFTTNDSSIKTRVQGYAANFIWMDEITWMNTFYP